MAEQVFEPVSKYECSSLGVIMKYTTINIQTHLVLFPLLNYALQLEYLSKAVHDLWILLIIAFYKKYISFQCQYQGIT